MMMKKYKTIGKLLATVVFASLFASCSEDTMDGINKNNNHPNDIQAKFLMTDALVSTGFSTVGGDFSLYSDIYMEYEAGVYGQMYDAETRNGEPSNATTYNNVWTSAFQVIKSLRTVIAKSSKDGSESGNDVTLGAAKVLLAYNFGVLTDLFGDVPFSEAAFNNPDGSPTVMQPKIDTQESVYAGIMKELDEAIPLLAGKDAGPYGSMEGKDLIYGGKGAAWSKAAYALKARYTMHLLNKSKDKPGDLAKVLDYISKSFASEKDEFKLAIYEGSAAKNPLYSFSNARDAFGASKSLVDKLIARNDPRAKESFMDYADSGFDQIVDPAKINVAPNGTNDEVQYTYSLPVSCYAITAPTMLMSYHELMFIKAEALCRLNRIPEAETALQTAIAAAFVNQANTIKSASVDAVKARVVTTLDDPAVAAAYYTNNIKALFTANPLKETMIQKYLGMFGASGEGVESFTDYRRMQAAGENFVTLSNPLNTTKFPLRFGYGSSDVLANRAVKAAFGDGQYVYTEKVWWAGGTR